jgi:hypothetical protein
MSIARDVIPQQILGSCADCQSASLSFAPASDAGLPSPSSTSLPEERSGLDYPDFPAITFPKSAYSYLNLPIPA